MINDKEKVMILREFRPDDAPMILSWCKDKRAFRRWSADRYKDFPALPEDMLKQYDGADKFPFTALEEGEIVGHLLLRYPSADKSIVRFGFVIVDIEKRGKGLGKQMLKLAIDLAFRRFGARKITLGVFCDNLAALGCYQSLGFRAVEEGPYLIDGEEWKGVEMELEECDCEEIPRK